jgi:Zn-dependent peptidase ImmA (M78 family)
MLIKKIENLASSILTELNINSAPVDIKAIAKKKGATIKPYEVDEKISGMLFIKDGNGIISYNPTESAVRQRFTIAHELGHLLLHKKTQDIFVDKQFQVHFRNENSATGQDIQELEANAFAAAILMPKDLLLTEIKKHNFDLGDESAMKELAKLFNVSLQAMTFRMVNLGFFSLR